jgi:cell division protein FtsN
MPQDFAKKTRSPRTNSKKKPVARKKPATRGQAPAWVWLFTGVVVGAFAMFLVYLSGISPKPSQPASVQEDSQEGAEPANKPQPKPEFGFYTLLKENEIELNKATQDHYKGEARDPMEYTLQVGSFKKASDADRVRAELLLLNLNARAEKATMRSGEIWHRVLVGPFTNPSKMQKARSILVSANFEAFVFKKKISP